MENTDIEIVEQFKALMEKRRAASIYTLVQQTRKLYPRLLPILIDGLYYRQRKEKEDVSVKESG